MSKTPLYLEQLLGAEYPNFVGRVLIPRFESLVEEGSVSEKELHRLGWNASHNDALPSGTLEPLNEPSLTNKDVNGDLFRQRYAFDDVSVDFFVKVAITSEEAEREMRNTQWVSVNIGDSPISVPDLVFASPTKKTLISDFVRAPTLFEHIHQDGVDPVHAIQWFAREYLQTMLCLDEQFTEYLPGMRLQQRIPEEFRFSAPFRKIGDMGEYLISLGFEDDADVLTTNITDDLNAARSMVIQGDEHGRNILVSESGTQMVDWLAAKRNGFPEMGVGRLIQRSGLTIQQQTQAMRAASHELARDGVTAEESYALLQKFVFSADLVSWSRANARRTSDAGDIALQISEVADVLVYRAQQGADEGLFSGKLVDFARRFGGDASRVCGPITLHSSYTKELPLTEPVVYNANDSLESIAQAAGRARRRPLRRAAIAAGLATGLATMTGLGIFGLGQARLSDQARENAQVQQRISTALEQQVFETTMSSEILWPYLRIVNQMRYDERMAEYDVAPAVKNANVPVETLNQISLKYDLPEDLLWNISRVNRVRAGFRQRSRDYFDGITIIDPFVLTYELIDWPKHAGKQHVVYDRPHIDVDLLQEADKAAKRISDLRDSYGSLPLALAHFAFPVRDGNVTIGYENLVLNMRETPDALNEIVSGMLNGVWFAWDVGIGNTGFPLPSVDINMSDLDIPFTREGCGFSEYSGRLDCTINSAR